MENKFQNAVPIRNGGCEPYTTQAFTGHLVVLLIVRLEIPCLHFRILNMLFIFVDKQCFEQINNLKNYVNDDKLKIGFI